MEKIEAGYVAYNGHVFSENDARLYNMDCEKARAFPTEWNKDAAHRTFCLIIGLYDAKQNDSEKA
jgi:hypothetical protein